MGALLGYVLHHTRGTKVKIDLVVNTLLWQVTKHHLAHAHYVQAAFLAACAVVYGLYDLKVSQPPQMTLFAATAYNAFQVRY